jgi:hypothetical protein
MTTLRFLIINACLLFTLITPLRAEEVQQGKLYSQGTQIESAQLGVAFTIPNGWQGAWPNGSAYFVLESGALQSTMFMSFDQLGKQQLMQTMSQNIPLDSGMVLQPLSAPKAKGSLITGQYQVMGAGTPMHAVVVGRELRQGFSVALIALTYNKNETVSNVASNMIRAMTTKEPQTAQANSGAAGGSGSWQAYMKGRYIARYHTGSGYSEKQELWLCSDGTFYSSFNMGGYSMNGASGASQSSGRGYWKATGSVSGAGTLILQFGAGKVVQGSGPGFDWTENSAGGERWTFQLVLRDKLYLDNTQWLRGNNEYCR